jgi:hypothetical protein
MTAAAEPGARMVMSSRPDERLPLLDKYPNASWARGFR